jgi:asparagine synthase (glutamine-hydrolysing)
MKILNGSHFYERGFNGIYNGYRVTERFLEYSSPFQDKDFLEYAMRIPLPVQNDKGLYINWILSEVPEVAEYPWAYTGVKINAGYLEQILHNSFQFLKTIINRTKNSTPMNPFEYWYQTNPKLRECFETYYATNITRLSKNLPLLNDAQKLFTEGTCLEKTQVLTLLAAMKLYSL